MYTALQLWVCAFIWYGLTVAKKNIVKIESELEFIIKVLMEITFFFCKLVIRAIQIKYAINNK